jgi:hypothetical protein
LNLHEIGVSRPQFGRDVLSRQLKIRTQRKTGLFHVPDDAERKLQMKSSERQKQVVQVVKRSGKWEVKM